MKTLSKTLLLGVVAIAVVLGGLGAVSPVLAEKSNQEVPADFGSPLTGETAVEVEAAVVAPAAESVDEEASEAFSSFTVSFTKDYAAAEVQARLDSFAASVSNGNANQITGIYVDGVLANKVTRQPEGNAGYVTTNENEVSQFRMAAQYGSNAFLGHNYLAGAVFFELSEGQVITVVYGDGRMADYQIQSIRHFQALSPNSPYSKFVDLDGSGETLTAAELFYQMYNSDNPVVLQTCIANEGISTWGRLFVIAVPLS
ncbi:MAG TPA: hypothetical protein VI703_04280 [Anaerolineales bacterium]|nr:hypothetical protein [Anaerolineales bacterium]